MMLECTLKGGRIPPTKAALVQHNMHVAAYQAGHSWVQVIIASPEIPSPSEWGLEQERNTDGECMEVHWIILLEATQASESCSRVYCTLLPWWNMW